LDRYELPNGRLILLTEGDITKVAVDAIVNAANSSLLGGGGVDGAIHRAGGPSILAECRLLGGCPTGEARITGAGQLPARHVIHAVGPVYRDGKHGEPDLLASAYRSSLMLAESNMLASIAFPSISTGAYGYPVDGAAAIALGVVETFLSEQSKVVKEVRFVLFGSRSLRSYMAALDHVAPGFGS